MPTIVLQVWKTDDGIHLEKPAGVATCENMEFNPNAPCRVCGEAVLNLSTAGPDVCPWCDGNANRPKMLNYQVEAIQREFIEKYAVR